MKPRKQLSEYTISGLLFIGARTDDSAVKAEVLQELRNRRTVADARKEADAANRETMRRLRDEIAMQGDQQKGDPRTRKENRDLFAAMKQQAFDYVDIPSGLSPYDTLKKYNRAIHDKATELYRDFKRGCKDGEIQENRSAVQQAKKEHKRIRDAYTKAKRVEADAYRNARFPLIGALVTFADVSQTERRIGVLKGVSFQRDMCLFRVRIDTGCAGVFKRALSVLEPFDNKDSFNTIKRAYLAFEEMERTVAERDRLMHRVSVLQERICELNPTVEDYIASGIRQEWLGSDEVARDFARKVSGVDKIENELLLM